MQQKKFHQYYFLENDFGGKKKMSTKNVFDKKFPKFFFSSELFPRKWFCNKKKFSTKITFDPNCFEEFILQQKKNSIKKFSKIFYYPNCFRGNDFAAKKNFEQKIFRIKTIFRRKRYSKQFFSTKLFPRK